MIIRSKDKVQVIGKNKSVWVLDTNALTVTHNTVDTEPTVTAFSSDHIKYRAGRSFRGRRSAARASSADFVPQIRRRSILASESLPNFFSG